MSVSGTFASFTDEELTAKADMILQGRIVGPPTTSGGRKVTEAARTEMRRKGLSEEAIDQMAEEEANSVYTIVRVRPSEILKGNPGRGDVEVLVLGGEAEGVSVVAEDFPTFEVGEEVLLFLGREYDGALGPLAVYRVKGDKALNRDMGANRETDVRTLKATIRAEMTR